MRAPQNLAISDHQTTSPIRKKQTFVRIKYYGVGMVDSGHPPTTSFSQLKEASVGRINVKPQVFSSSNFGDCLQWIDRTGAGRSSVCDNTECPPAGRSIGGGCFLQKLLLHPQLAVNRYISPRLVTNPHYSYSLRAA